MKNKGWLVHLIPEERHADAPDDPVESVVDDQELEGGAREPPHGEGQHQHQELHSVTDEVFKGHSHPLC